MAAEVEALVKIDNAVLFVRVLFVKSVMHNATHDDFTCPFLQLLENVDLHKRLLMESFLVTNDLHRNKDSSLVVHAAHDLAKTSFAEEINHFVAICEVISLHDIIITAFIVIAKVRGCRLQITHNFSSAESAGEINVGIVHNFTPFEYVQIKDARCRVVRHTTGWFGSCPKRVEFTRSRFKIFSPGGQFPHFFFGHQIVAIQNWFCLSWWLG